MSNDITDLIAALKSDELSLDQVAQKFRERSWPATTPPAPVTQAEWEARLMADPDPYVPGSFDDVAAAFFRGDITLAQYSVLSEAAAASINAEKKRRDTKAAGSE